MPTDLKGPHKYAMPTPGQVFRKEEQDGRWDYGICDGVKAVYVGDKVVSWQASITTGFRDFRGVLTHTAAYHNTTDWHPAPADAGVPAEVLGLLEGLVARLDGQAETLASFEVSRDILVARVNDLIAKTSTLKADHADEMAKTTDMLRQAAARLDVLEAAAAPLGIAQQPIAPAPVASERPRRGASA